MNCMMQFLARFSEPVRSVHAPSWADFIAATPAFKLWFTQVWVKRHYRRSQRLAQLLALYLEGDGTSGPLGVKEVAKTLNAREIRTRLGARFGVGPVHKILTNPIYVGEWRFNRRHAKTGWEKPATEVISVEVPPIIDRQTFDEARRTLKARNPRSTPPRVTTGPVLLTGLAHCASCGSAMTMRTGTSKTGKVYRYYSCSGAARMGKSACKGRSIPMDRLDQLVTSHIADRLLVPGRIAGLLAEIGDRRAMAGGEVRERIDQLSREAGTAEDKLRRLYALVEDGVTDLDEVLKVRLADIKADRERREARSIGLRVNRGGLHRQGENRTVRLSDARKHHGWRHPVPQGQSALSDRCGRGR